MMKYISTFLSIFIFNVSAVVGQNKTIAPRSWDKIVIADTYAGWSEFTHIFGIDKSTLSLYAIDQPDSVIKEVDPKLIDELLGALSNPANLRKDPLLMFGRDSVWLIHHARQLWEEYSETFNKTAETDSIAIHTLKNYEKVKNAAWLLQESSWTDDYPFTSVALINGQDTLSISSNGQYPYMLPWNVNGVKIYNSKISTIISQILPDDKKSNRSRMAGKGFNKDLIDKIYSLYLEDTLDYVLARDKYPGQFRKLNKHFEIVSARLGEMSSIEWGNLFPSPCLELVLKDTTLSNHIHFSCVFGRRHSLHPIIAKRKELIKDLTNNPIYEYALRCKNCLGEIHFVNDKSLSGKARANFLRDVKDNGLKNSDYEGKLKDAIFFELTEKRNSKESFSRWIFLKNGTVILWELRGTFLMNLPDSIIKNQGYICRTLSEGELKSIAKNE